jgi:hypothetical protein
MSGHLHEATPADAERAAGDRVAAEILAEFGLPETYEKAVAVIAIAYLRGGQDTLRWAQQKIEGRS